VPAGGEVPTTVPAGAVGWLRRLGSSCATVSSAARSSWVASATEVPGAIVGTRGRPVETISVTVLPW